MSSATAAQQGLMPVYAPNPSPRVAQGRLVAEQQAAQMAQRALQSAPVIDPRITNPPTSLPPVQINGAARTSTPPHQTQNNSQNNTPSSIPRPASPKENGATSSQAQSIPSISSLVHAENSVSVMSDNKSNSSRTGSKSPKENGEQKPKDIPHEKLNIIGEDQRAIRVLDRKFVFWFDQDWRVERWMDWRAFLNANKGMWHDGRQNWALGFFHTTYVLFGSRFDCLVVILYKDIATGAAFSLLLSFSGGLPAEIGVTLA
jgi:hypothetical protein